MTVPAILLPNQQVPGVVRSISAEDTLSMRQQTQFLWDTYFSSIEKIVTTTLEIINERVQTLQSRSSFIWNSVPGALVTLPEFSQSVADFPFYWRHLGVNQGTPMFFTAVIYSTASGSISSSMPVYRLAKAVGRSTHLHTVIFVWRNAFPTDVRWPFLSHVRVVHKMAQSVADRLLPFSEISTDAVLSLNEDVELVTNEVDFALSVWQNHPERIIGFFVRNHVWDDSRQRWSYTSKSTNDYSVVLTQAAFYHRYYLYLYSNWLPQSLQTVVTHLDNCDDILFNFLVAHVIRRPPIKVSSRQTDAAVSHSRHALVAERLVTRQFCISHFAEQFGYMPLQRSSVRMEPLLFKDPVSILRKKYRQMEANGSS